MSHEPATVGDPGATLLEVFEQRGKPQVRHRAKSRLQVDKITIMRIPVDAYVGDAVVLPEDSDQRHALLDESAGQQHPLPELVPAVALAHLGWLRGQIEGSLRRGRQDHVERALLVSIHRSAAKRAVAVPLDLFEQTAPGVMTWTTPSGRSYTTRPTQYEE